MANAFTSVQYPKVGSNTFDLSHDVKLSFRMGKLYPTFVMDVLPGDRIRMSTETMLRFAPLISPVMHRVNVTTHFFFVPNRILWPNWEKWITGDLDAVPPYLQPADGRESIPSKSLGDYMGLPTGKEGMVNVQVNALPFAAYWRIFNEYYRDQNLVNEKHNADLTNGNNGYLMMLDAPAHRAWMHDYFTSALPFAQKGDSVALPLGNFDDVEVFSQFNSGNRGKAVSTDGLGTNLVGNWSSGGGGEAMLAGSIPAMYDPNGTLRAKTSDLEAQSADINTLRRAFRLQEWLERNARGGTRYIENIMAHFGVRSSDARLNRPEFLGGAYQKMVISEVLSTAETEVPVGQMAGHGISVGSGKNFTYRAEEHGWIIGLINVQPVTAYQDGVNKMFQRKTRLEYYWPSFANIGEQEIKMVEIFVDGSDRDDNTFGYIPRYSEYRFINSRVAGEMRTTLNHWHMGRTFATAPALNETFISADPTTRIFAVQADADHIYGHIYNNVRALRKIPKFGTPSF